MKTDTSKFRKLYREMLGLLAGPEDVKPVLGVSALESIGFTVDPATHTLKRVSSAE